MRLTHRPRSALLVVAALALATVGLSAPAGAAPDGSRFRLADTQPTRDGATIAAEVTAAKRAARPDGRTAIVVKLTDDSLAAKLGSPAAPLDVDAPASRAYLAQLEASLDAFEKRVKAASPQARVTQRLDVVVGGVAMTLPADDVAKIARDPQVEAVYVDSLEQLQTEVTPRFVGATSAWSSLGGQSKAGEGTIVGVLDSGIWPEHPSLSDPDPAGKPYPAPRPATGASARDCDFSGGSNPGAAFTCNNKLIGAYTYMDTYNAQIGLTPDEYTSARDDDGHGTHTATTAAGNGRVAASIGGVPRGTVSGIAPRAHVIAYKVCGAEGCYSSDSVAAVARAIIDDVDVINFSISGGSNPYADAVSLAFLDAYNAGVFVAASAGNAGPGANTTDHREPWVTTVAASTGPRSFVGSSTLTSSDGATLSLTGVTVSAPLTTAAPVVDAGAAPYNDPLCQNGTADAAFAGKVVLCKRGGNGRVQKGYNVRQRGAVGMLLYNQSTAVTDLETDNHFLPALHSQLGVGEGVIAFLAAHPGVTATIASGVATPTQGDVMASFSSRGGNAQTLGVSKPDVTAPGVQILAGASPTTAAADAVDGELFQAIAGTSMSSPHVAGAAALLADLHPTWSPGQIHSALMTTANTNTVKEDGATPTDAFDDGSGRISLDRAKDPYFTVDETGANYVAKQGELQNTNYPSVYVPVLAGKTSVTRTLKSVSKYDRWYKVSVASTPDFTVTVSPSSFKIPAGGSRTLTFTIDGKDVPLDATRFATVKFTSGTRAFTIPVTAVRKQGTVAVDKTCAPDPVAVRATTACTVTMTNNGTATATVQLRDKVPSRLGVVPGSVTGGTSSYNLVTASATIPGKQTPAVNVDYVDPSTTPGGGYLPLSLFGVTPIAGVGDETITNFSVPAFTVAGVTYTSVGLVSNGYVILGGGSGADIQFLNAAIPSASLPNNYIAPFWTDLNPGAGGAMRIGILTDGVNDWVVAEYDAVQEYSNATRTHSFQVWVGVNGIEDVTMAWGPNNGNGDGGFATVGVENPDGTQGKALYVDGVGTLPQSGNTARVTGTPGSTTSATVTYQAKGKTVGTYVNYAEVTGDTFAGTAIGRFTGTVTPAP